MVMEWIIMYQLLKEVEKNKLCKQWGKIMIELYSVKIDGYVKDHLIKYKLLLIKKMTID